MVCPRCGSNNITTNNKGYGIGKGVVGAALLGPFGLVAGNIGKNDIICTCLDCGHRWELKKQIEQKYTNYYLQEFTDKERQKELKQERIERANNSLLGDCCPVCGEKLYSDKKYCPNCTASYKSKEELNDIYHCGQYKNATIKDMCIYAPHCIHYSCKYLKQSDKNTNTGCITIFGIIFLIFLFLYIIL